jgi:hypothetical protein
LLRELLFILWDIEKFYGFKESGINFDFKGLFNKNADLIFESASVKKNLNYNKNEKFLDLEENLNAYLDFWRRITNLKYNDYDKILYQKLRELEVDVVDLQEWEYSMKEDVGDKLYVGKLEPIWSIGEKLVKEWREEWEREWREGKRDYLNNEISRIK